MNIHVSEQELEDGIGGFLKRAEAGETVTVTRDGRPVARLEPVLQDEARREEARKAVIETMRRGYDLGGEKFDRNTVYDR